ncbi:MAG: glycohydrolase toxin TNT-related protein [Coprococcus sp.]
MENRGVLLYVDLGRLEDEPYRLSKIYDTLGQYIDDIRRQRDIIYISKMAESLDISSLDRYRAQLVDEYDRLGTLKKILDEAYDLYKECNEKFEASGQTLCNLYAETPWYETSEGKLAIGIGVLVVTAAVAIVCPAVLGAAAATVTQSIATSALVGSAISGIMNGAASVKAGKSFFDGFASGVEEGAIIGALCGMFGAGTAAMMTGAEMTVGNVFAARVINAVGDATIGTATYIYHENKYDKAITGGDVAKTWAECAITSFVLRSVFEGGKSSSKADGKNRGMSTSKGRVESERSITCEGGSETSWYKADGTINYPPNNGAVPGTEVNMSLKPGDTFGRYGNIGNKSNFVTQTGANADKLALPPTTDPNIYQEFRVIKEIPNTIQAEIAAWGGSAGGGLQYELPMPILQLIREGYIVPK